MPRLSRWLVRAALVYLLLGVTIGALLLTHKGLSLDPALWRWLPAHIEFLLVGWIVQFTMGVAFWIFPRFWERPRRPRESHVRIAFVSLNLGIWLVVAGTSLGLSRNLLFLGRLLELVAVAAAGRSFWPRVVSREG